MIEDISNIEHLHVKNKEADIKRSTAIIGQKNRPKKKSFNSLIFIFLFSLFSLITWYEIPQDIIQVQQVNIDKGEFSITGIAKDLIVQEITKKGIWASKGYDIYFKANGENHFKRMGTLPVPLGISYLGNSRIFREIFNKQELLELLILPSETLIVFGGGFIYRSTDKGQSFMEVGKLEHFGFGKGRGIMPDGHAVDSSGNIYYGEYWRNSNREAVRLMKSSNKGISWEPVYVFPKNSIRHIHAVQYDPYFDAIFIATGDRDSECNIMYSTDGGTSFSKIGSGRQKWRAVSLLLTKNYVYWGMDGFSSTYPQPKIIRWDRITENTEELETLNSFAYYSGILEDGTLILSTDGTNGHASLFVSRDGYRWRKLINWARNRDDLWGTIRIETNKNNLVISNINLSYQNNSLLILNHKSSK